MRMRLACATALPALLSLISCGDRGAPPPAVPKGNLHAINVVAPLDPTVPGARVVPEVVDEEKSYGSEPGGGIRTIVAGYRVVTLPTGAVLATNDRLSGVPSAQQVKELPERLGGGFLFQIGTTIWRSDRWLAPARPIFTSPSIIKSFLIGLDRLYVRTQSGAFIAFDAKTGARLDLGPWPQSPFIGDYAAADAWRAVAISDLRGVVATFDAGATWRPLGIRLDAKFLVPYGDAIAIGGTDPQKQDAWYEVRGDGHVARLPGRPAALSADKPQAVPLDAAARAFGKRPLLAAIEDGWPLADGSAVVARDGAIGRVRLSDGALVEAAEGAYPLKPSRCHPVRLETVKQPSAFGFVCGESRGKTVLYRYDPIGGRMVEVKRWEKARSIVSAGNGSLSMRGGCAENANVDDGDKAQQTYCLYVKGATGHEWREIRVRGDIGGERIVVLADGRVVVVSPPHGDLTAARLTVLDKGKAMTVPVTFPPLPADVARVLRYGVWMDGFEERKGGVIGSWVEAAGSMLGLELSLNGHAKYGKYVREAGAPMVSGRYGLGWTSARRGYETTDGGMTWTDIELPEPISGVRAVKSRACGPVGCNAAGWLRVGWGAQSAPAKVEVPPPPKSAAWRAPQQLDLECEATHGTPPDPAKPPDGKDGKPAVVALQPHHYYSHYSPYGANQDGLAQLPAFYTQAAPVLKNDERGLALDVLETIDRTSRSGSLARFYTWGPKAAEWEHQGKWVGRWVWPYGGWPEIRSTVVSNAPYANLEAAKKGFGQSSMSYFQWPSAMGDDPHHMLLFGRRNSPIETLVVALESDRAPLEVRRLDNEPIPDVEAAVRVNGHWYLATQQAASEMQATVIWVMDGPFLRELARIPRAGFEGRPAARLARRSDGRALGLVVDGQPSADRPTAQRWVLPIDADTGAASDPELIGPTDLADRVIEVCASEGPGWVYDGPLPGGARLKLNGQSAGNISSPLARIRLTKDSACVSHLAGPLELYGRSNELFTKSTKGGSTAREPSMPVAVFSSQKRFPLRCGGAKK